MTTNKAKHAKRYAPLFGALLTAALLVTPAVDAAGATSQAACWQTRPAERAFRNDINAERAAIGVGNLTIDPELSKVARRHTKDMIKANKANSGAGIFHSTSQQFNRRITNWSMVGENVGVGGDENSLHRAFMNSAPHAHNVLMASYNHVGIGVREWNNRMWVTVIFQATGDPGTTLRMPRC